jgi:hypothetical protein
MMHCSRLSTIPGPKGQEGSNQVSTSRDAGSDYKNKGKRKELLEAGINSSSHDAAVSATMAGTRDRYQDLIDLRPVRGPVTEV